MTRPPRRSRRAALVAAGILMLALPGGCDGLLPKPPERQLYRLTPVLHFTPGALPQVAAQLAVATPSAPAGLDGTRIALSRSPVTLDYFADAEWTDRVPFLVRSALIEGFEKSRAFAAVGPESLGLNANFVLLTAIREFTAVYDSPKRPPRVVVALDANLVRLPDRRVVAHTSLHREAAAAANALPAIVNAFNSALGRAVEAEVTWAASNRALSRHRRSLR